MIFLILTVHLTTNHTHAQDNGTGTVYERLLRIEIPAKSDNETYRLIPCRDRGVILFYRSVEAVDQDKVKWYFSFYDKDLQQLWSRSIGLTNTLEFRDFSIDSDTLCLLFRAGDKAKDASGNFQLIRLTLDQGLFRGNGGKFPENAEVVDFIVNRNTAYVGINVKNEPARLMVINLGTGNQTIAPLGQGSFSTLIQLYLDSAGAKIYTSIFRSMARIQSEFVLSAFDLMGTFLSETTITSSTPEYNLNAMRFIPSDSGVILIAGTYGAPPVQKGSSKNLIPGESTGFFFTSVRENQQQSMTFYNFLELKNANQLIAEKNAQNLKKKSTKKDKSIDEFSMDLTLLLQPLVIQNNEIILVTESFFPQYHTENFTDYDFYGRPYTNTYSVFDGYRFTNSIITSFDKKGALLWDNSIEIRNLLSFELNPKVTWFSQGINTVIAYLSDGKIASKIIHKNELVEKLDYTPLDLEFPNDKLISETKSRMMPWYNNFFICYGYHEIKNVTLDRNNKRLVFYFNKIRFD